MLPYFLLLFISIFIPLLIYPTKTAYVGYNDKDIVAPKRNTLTLLLYFLGLFVLLSLRGMSVGNDLYEYKNIFEMCAYISFNNLPNLRWEIGYVFYNKIIALISPSYRFFLIVTALLSILPLYKLYSNEKHFSYLLIVIFINMPCFVMLFSGLRQAIAISIGALAYMALEKKKIIVSFLLILLSTSFHISGLMLLLIYPANYLKIKTKHLILIIPIILSIFIFRVQILKYLISIMPSKYIESYGEIQYTGAIGMLLLFLIFSAFAFIVSDEKKMSSKEYFMRNILLIATIFQIFVPIHGLVQRASYYFLIFIPLSIISVIKVPKKKWNSISNIAIIILTVFFSVYFFYNAIFSTNNLLGAFPYNFYWKT